MDRLENLKNIIMYLMADEHVSHRIPSSLEERQRMMRALMNVWEPRPIAEDFLTMQDAELQMQREDKGVVEGCQCTGIGLLGTPPQLHRQLHPLSRWHPASQGVCRHYARTAAENGRGIYHQRI